MVNRFVLQTLFDEERLHSLVENFGFKRMSVGEINNAMEAAFTDYILSALSEVGSSQEDRNRLYIEASHHLSQASKLLAGMPHPVGKMSYRLQAMLETLNKLVEGKSDFAAARAMRFMEKNLVRRLRDIWQGNTSTPFYVGDDGSGKSPRDFILTCFQAAGREYPEISWFNEVDEQIADSLIKSIKR